MRADGFIACRRAVCWGLRVADGGCEVVGGGGVFFVGGLDVDERGGYEATVELAEGSQ